MILPALPVALHPLEPIERGDTVVYSGTVDAVLNFTTPIKIYLEWVNVGDNEGEGQVLGYYPAELYRQKNCITHLLNDTEFAM